MMLQGMALMQKEGVSFMQIFKPQQSTDTFVERVFVNYQCEASFNVDVSSSHDSEGTVRKKQTGRTHEAEFSASFL